MKISPYYWCGIAVIAAGAIGFIAGQHHSESTAGNPNGSGSETDGSADRIDSSSGSARENPHERRPEMSGATRVKSAMEAMELRDRSLRFRALGDYYSGLPPSHFDDELEQLSQLAEADRLMGTKLLFMHWGEKEPTVALEQTKDMGFEGTMFYENIMQSWAAKHPQEAGAFCQSNAIKSQLGMHNYRSKPWRDSSGSGARKSHELFHTDH